MVFANEPFIVEAYKLRIQCDGSARSVDECEKELWISGLDNCQSEVFIFCLPPEGKSLHSHFFSNIVYCFETSVFHIIHTLYEHYQSCTLINMLFKFLSVIPKRCIHKVER